MGRLVMIKCDCGYEYDNYSYGINSSYPEIQKHQTALVKSGHYGKYWRELLNNDPELLVNAEYRLYQCTCCHKLISEYCMDLYKSSEDDYYYTPNQNEIIYQYKHICPTCKKRMEMIPLSENDYKSFPEQKEELVICPKCGNIATIRFCGHTL